VLRREQRHVARELHHIVARVLAARAAFSEPMHNCCIAHQLHCMAAYVLPLHAAQAAGHALRS